MASKRAQRGGGREIALPDAAANAVGMTYGNSGNGSAWFGPGTPMTPQAPPEVEGRQFDFPQGINTFTSTRPYAPISFAALQAFADSYDLLRLVIETRKDAMERLRWVIQLKDPTDKMTPQKKNKIKELTKLFKKPDGEHKWNAWLRMLLEDLFVIDAATLHRRRTRGGKIISYDPIDGSTMRRVIDNWGRTPENDNDLAYQQILKGMPAVNYKKKEIFYMPRNVRNREIYGYSPVQQILMTINIGLRRQVFQLNFFTEGNMPPALIGVPETWTPDQIRTFQEWFDGILSGNLAERRKARFVPNAVGKTYIPTQETELFGAAEEWLARVVCFAFSISPQPFLKMMNRATADSSQREAAATGLAPIQAWVKDFIDDALEQDLDAEDYEFIWRGDDELDPVKRQAITEADVKTGLMTVNEGRVANGREPYDDKQFDQPMFMTSNGLAPLVLTADSQGGHQVGPDGKPIKSTASAPGKPTGAGNPANPADQQDEDAGAADELEKTLASLVAAGDAGALSAYLSTINRGASV